MSSDSTSTVSMRIRLRYPDVETFVDRYASNISSGGMFIQSRTPPEVGTLLRFELCLSGGASVVRGEGKVVWIKDFDEAAPTEPHGMGVRFTQLDEASQVMIERVLTAKGELEDSSRSGTAEVHALRGKATLARLAYEGSDVIATLLDEADATLGRLIEESSLSADQLQWARRAALERVSGESVGLEELDRLLAEAPMVALDRESALAALQNRLALEAPPPVRRAQTGAPAARLEKIDGEEELSTNVEQQAAPAVGPADTDDFEAVQSEEAALDAEIEIVAEAGDPAPSEGRERPPQSFDPSILRAAASVARASAESEEGRQFDLSEASVPGHPSMEEPGQAPPDTSETRPLEVPSAVETSSEWKLAAEEWQEGQPQLADGAEEVAVDDLEEIEIEEAPPAPARSHLSDFDQEYRQQHPYQADDFDSPDTFAASGAGGGGGFSDFSSDEESTSVDAYAEPMEVEVEPDEPTLLSANTLQDPDMEDSAFEELAASAGPRTSTPSLDALVDEVASEDEVEESPPERRRKKHTSDVFRRLFGKK